MLQCPLSIATDISKTPDGVHYGKTLRDTLIHCSVVRFAMGSVVVGFELSSFRSLNVVSHGIGRCLRLC